MNPAWVVAAISLLGTVLGVAGQLWISSRISARSAGVHDERMRAHGYRIKDLEDGQRGHSAKLGDHGERIARVEARVGVSHQGLQGGAD